MTETEAIEHNDWQGRGPVDSFPEMAKEYEPRCGLLSLVLDKNLNAYAFV